MSNDEASTCSSQRSLVMLRCSACIHWEEHDVESCKLRQSHRIIRKVHQLLTNQITAGMTERIGAMLDCFLETTGSRFCVHDLSIVMNVLEILLLRKQSEALFAEYISRILTLAQNTPSFGSTLCGHSHSLVIIVEDYVTRLGLCLTYAVPTLHQETVALALNCLFCAPEHEDVPGGTVQWSLMMEALEQSEAVKIVCDILETALPYIYIVLVEFLHTCCKNSLRLASTILERDCLNTILVRMSPKHPLNDAKMDVYENVWSVSMALLVELLHKYEQIHFVRPFEISQESMHHLLDALETTNDLSSDLYSKTKRNSLMSILLKLEKHFWNSGVREAFNRLHLCHDFIYAVCPFNHSEENWHSKFETNSDDTHDVLLRKMLLICVYHIVASDMNLSEQEKLDVAKQTVPNVNKNKEICKFQIRIGRSFVPYLREEFLKCRQEIKLLKVINKIAKQNVRNNILVEQMKTINFICNLNKNEKMLKRLKENGAVSTLIYVSGMVLSGNQFLDNFSKQLILHAADALTALVKENIPHQIEHFDDLINITNTTLVQLNLQKQTNQLIDVKVVISVLDLLGEIISDNTKTQDKFIKSGNVYKIMNLLQLNDHKINHIVLRLLIDISENPKSLPYLLTWRNHDSCEGIHSTLCDLWRRCEANDKLKRDVNGIIDAADIAAPLMGENQKSKLNNIPFNSSPAILDFYFSIKTKIHALVMTINAKYTEHFGETKNKLDIASSLDVKDRITMCLIENYFPLKLNEVWQEIIRKFEIYDEDIIQINEEMFKHIIENNERFSIDIRNQQISILNQASLQECEKEHELYSFLLNR